jgi:uncharacterized protein (DUF433 family)
VGLSFSAVALELLEEGLRMRRVPGIVFTDGSTGRRPSVAGTGIDVWEIIASWKAVGESMADLRDEYAWLDEFQIRAALTYYGTYTEEIDDRLACEEHWSPERIREKYPFLARPR